jgi:hypothetical protein
MDLFSTSWIKASVIQNQEPRRIVNRNQCAFIVTSSYFFTCKNDVKSYFFASISGPVCTGTSIPIKEFQWKIRFALGLIASSNHRKNFFWLWRYRIVLLVLTSSVLYFDRISLIVYQNICCLIFIDAYSLITYFWLSNQSPACIMGG